MKILVGVAGLCLVFGFVWERVDVVRVGYQVEHLKSEKVRLERERDQLRVKLSTLSAPDRIAKVATDRLGLVPPQNGQVIMVQARPMDVPSSPQAIPAPVRVASNYHFDGRR